MKKQPANPPETPISSIQTVVADYYGLTVDKMLAPVRTVDLVFPRQLAMAICRDIFGFGQKEIAVAFKMKDHGTVIHSCRKVENTRQQKPALNVIYSLLVSKIMDAEKARING